MGRELPVGREPSRVRSILAELIKIVLFAAAYLGAYAFARWLSRGNGTRLWLPDSVLLCALLLAPIRKWWLYLLVTMPARFFPGVTPHVQAWFLFLTWGNDVAKALLVAYLLRYKAPGAVRFNSVRRYATYLAIAVVLAPVFSGFFGALTRHLALEHPFWPAYGQWALGDVLANLIVTPALLMWLSGGYRHLRDRRPEAILWTVTFALSLCSVILFSWFGKSIVALFLPFPFLVWAALRLGTIGASTGLFLTTVFLIIAVSRHHGAFFSLLAHDMHFLQLFMTVLSLPIMFVAILFGERERVEARLRRDEARLREKQEELNRNYRRTRDLAGSLIQAQEAERSRIARELHDGINQQVAYLTISLDRLECAPPDQLARAHDEVSELKRVAEEVSQGLRDVAHQLHSTALQHLGLIKALHGLCRTFSHQRQVAVTLEAETQANPPADIGLCLYRVAQEALNNAVQHGKADRITVSVTQRGPTLRLKIEDNGTGFDPLAAGEGLGLVSMRERLRVVGGNLTVSSSSGQGSVIEAVVDLPTDNP
jgi:signal transduction histidine kinase